MPPASSLLPSFVGVAFALHERFVEVGAASCCGCNGAWHTHTNGTITSAMDGGCLQASGAKIGVSPCTGKSPSSG